MRADERERLAPWLDAFTRVFKQAPIVEPLAPPVQGAPDDLFTISFPSVFQPPELLGGTGHFRQSPALVEHLRRFGYRWNEAGRVVTSPTPSTFNALLPLLGQPDAGYPVAYACEDASTLSMAPWLLSYLGGTLPVHVASAAWYARSLGDGSGRHDGLAWHLSSLAHDLTVHALNYHLIPRPAIEIMHERIRTGVSERYAAWERGEPAPLTMSFFIDNDLNRYCYAVWCRCRAPSEFAGRFLDGRSFDQLLAALAVRLDETRAGRGDVASGDTRDLPPLQPVEFVVR